MSFTDTSFVITSFTICSGVIFLAKVVIISSLVAEFSVASSIGGGSSSSSAGGNTIGVESIIGGSNSGSGGSSGNIVTGNSGNYYLGNEVWVRNLDTQLLRLGSRLDQLMLRMDHLDSRVGRVQSQGHLRFDSIETNMQTTRQRLDLWSSQLNLFEEQLSRKWKNMESRFDSLVNSIDSKLDSKFNLIQRDNRRHGEYLTSTFNSVIISQEKLSERVVNSLTEINSTVAKTKGIILNTTTSLYGQLTEQCSSNTLSNVLSTFFANFTLRSCAHNPVQQQQQNNHNNHHHRHHSRNNNNQAGYDQLPGLPSLSNSQHYFHSPSSYYPHAQLPNGTTQVQLITSKVTNMFDELLKRSQNLEAIVKDTFTMSNMTRREVQDGFRAVIPMVNQISNGGLLGGNNGGGRSVSSNGGASSTEVMSMGLLLENLASVESMTAAVGRRMTELSHSIDERFEMVSMTLNGFLESCLRVQEKEELIEERLAMILERILDTLDNSTRNATETWEKVQTQLLKEQQQLHQNFHQQRHSHHRHHQQNSKRNSSSCSDSLIMASSLQRSSNNPQSRYASQGHNNDNQASPFPAAAAVSEFTSSSRNRSFYSTSPSSSTTRATVFHETDDDEQAGFLEADLENVQVGAGHVDEDHNTNDNDELVEGDERHHEGFAAEGGDEEEVEESSKINRSKPLFNTGNKSSHHHPHHHHQNPHVHQLPRNHQQFPLWSGAIGSDNVNRNVNPSANLPDPFPIPYPSSSTNSDGDGGSRTSNVQSPSRNFMTFSSQHNVNDNVNPAQQGKTSPSATLSSSFSSGLLGVRTMSTSDNNNGMGGASSGGGGGGNNAHVNSNSNNNRNNNHNIGDPHGIRIDFDDLNEEEKQRFWESWLPLSHKPKRAGSVPE